MEALYEAEVRQRYLEIHDTFQRELVTTIEILSPFNKALGRRGHVDFMEKRKETMSSTVHWIEIDLLRAGTRPPEVADKGDYYARLKRRGAFGRFEVWYIDLRDRLPTIAVPLRPPYDDAPLDLQDAFEDMYRRAHYAESMAYSEDILSSPQSRVQSPESDQLALRSTDSKSAPGPGRSVLGAAARSGMAGLNHIAL